MAKIIKTFRIERQLLDEVNKVSTNASRFICLSIVAALRGLARGNRQSDHSEQRTAANRRQLQPKRPRVEHLLGERRIDSEKTA